MANAAAITVTALTANAAISQPAVNTLDTGTSAVTLRASVPAGALDRLVIEVINTASANLKVEALAGDNPPAVRAGLGAVTLVAALAQNAVKMCGPFESARFAQNDGTSADGIDIKFTPASSTIGATVRAYLLPKTV